MICRSFSWAAAAMVLALASLSTDTALASPRNTNESFVVMPVRSYLLEESGTVSLELTADADGKASEVQILSSSGYSGLDAAALHQVRHLSISAGELTEDMRNGGKTKRVEVTFPARPHDLSEERVAALMAMTCRDAMREFEAKVGGATGTALVLVPPFADVLPVLSPMVERYAELVATPAEDIDHTFNGQMLAADVMLGQVVHHVSRIRQHCGEHPDELFLDATFSWEKVMNAEREQTETGTSSQDAD